MVLNGLPGRVEKNYPLKQLTTWKIGGPAEFAYWPNSAEDFVLVIERAKAAKVPVWLIGRGSNLLISDEGLPGITLVTTSLRAIRWGDYSVQVQAGYPLARLAQEAGERGWHGLEFARGIPGSVGGAVIMNAGAHGGEMAPQVESLSVLTTEGCRRTLERRDLEFGYRYCSLNGEAWILEATLTFSPGDRDEILHIMGENLKRRAINQPLEVPNAGSVFRNPTGDSAGRLIEAAGWKGRGIGGAVVSDKHANFIVNIGEAKASEVLALIEEIQKDIQSKYGVDLQTEVKYLGKLRDCP
ncbi:UDP-N-acetylmuramate dehydrogenase [Desulfosporosinus acidiphilus SJ4]|uniref:UDP-N-acetylenolpyruvoylglucosamine reductase n=1 Tax=Desulfosporosinus acidiphilus (strain DSM 22704 / JCM 16185 / SJ4) TaxID=646529 RepID=I4DA12_DESAJ|nr:UDP-N-acetylmuramate dehydrogenase [Desulfosporosinus acidiphilus]AFM42636.1 UDP-N-acetylmuramate dehydrogenase [Desulfosporosinus acidiphilus SJ4]